MRLQLVTPMKRYDRRSLIAGIGTAALIAVAGCLGDDDDLTTPPPEATPSNPPVDSLPAPSQGPEDAPTIAVFTDFSCPGCAQFKDDVYPSLRDGVVADGDARYEHVDWPFLDDASDAVANAGRAVQDHEDDEAFFEFAVAILDRQNEVSMDTIEEVAEDVAGLGEVAREAAEFGLYDEVISDDFAYGEDLGVGGTPTVAIDESLLSIDDGATADEVVADIEAAVADAA